eukprot:1198673-Pleurochrysis_carterae.AAC.1
MASVGRRVGRPEVGRRSSVGGKRGRERRAGGRVGGDVRTAGWEVAWRTGAGEGETALRRAGWLEGGWLEGCWLQGRLLEVRWLEGWRLEA